MVTDEQINEVFLTAATSRQRLYETNVVYEQAKFIYESKSAVAIFEGQIEGKNKEQRDAALAVHLNQYYVELYETEVVQRQARLAHDLNIFELGRVKALLRKSETEARLASITTS